MFYAYPQKIERWGKGKIMENYVVRIYRSYGKNPHKLIGLVEDVGVEGQRAFRNLEELWTILNPSRGAKATKRGKRKELA